IKDGQGVLGLQVEQLDGPVEATGGEPAAVGTERHPARIAIMEKPAYDFPALCIHETDPAISPCRSQVTPVGAVRHREDIVEDRTLVELPAVQQLSGGQAGDSYPPIHTGGCQA